VLKDPNIFLYTGDAVAHRRHNASVLSASVRQSVDMMRKYFNVKNVTAILGNADCCKHVNTIKYDTIFFFLVNDYEMFITDPANGTNPTIGMVDAPWQDTLSAEHFKEFDTRGYLWYALETNLVMISLNTVPYSIKHAPLTTYLEDPFGQFAWLENLLAQVRANNSFAYIVGHIPPIIDSFAGQSQWNVEYILRYKDIVKQYPDIIKAQFFGHVHNIEYRIPIENPEGVLGAPLFAAGAVSPYFGNNPSFVVRITVINELARFRSFIRVRFGNTTLRRMIYSICLFLRPTFLTLGQIFWIGKRFFPCQKHTSYHRSQASPCAI
jgi:sphingomyelin phosphodiesterase acid-like 3